MAECKTCRAPIVWAVGAATGKRMPVDADPAVEGNVLVSPTAGGAPVARVLSGVALDEARDAMPGQIHRSHFATCPNAARHRKPRR